MNPERGSLDFSQGFITPEDAIMFFENTDEGSDIEEKINEMIASVEGADQGELADKVQAAKGLQGSIVTHLSKLEEIDKNEVPSDVLKKARALADRLNISIAKHSQ
ncbi:MAG: hypothetical protein WC835_00895 [Candidatus Paceibacterota bacterium]|jgi:hypothetical protein